MSGGLLPLGGAFRFFLGSGGLHFGLLLFAGQAEIHARNHHRHCCAVKPNFVYVYHGGTLWNRQPESAFQAALRVKRNGRCACRVVKRFSGCLFAFSIFLPAQVFRRLPRAGASPCTPLSINHWQQHQGSLKSKMVWQRFITHGRIAAVRLGCFFRLPLAHLRQHPIKHQHRFARHHHIFAFLPLDKQIAAA